MEEKIKSLDIVYLQECPEDYYGETTWSADRIFDEDAKFVNIEYIKKVFKNVIEGKGLVIPRIVIKCIVDELEKMENKDDI